MSKTSKEHSLVNWKIPVYFKWGFWHQATVIVLLFPIHHVLTIPQLYIINKKWGRVKNMAGPCIQIFISPPLSGKKKKRRRVGRSLLECEGCGTGFSTNSNIRRHKRDFCRGQILFSWDSVSPGFSYKLYKLFPGHFRRVEGKWTVQCCEFTSEWFIPDPVTTFHLKVFRIQENIQDPNLIF